MTSREETRMDTLANCAMTRAHGGPDLSWTQQTGPWTGTILEILQQNKYNRDKTHQSMCRKRVVQKGKLKLNPNGKRHTCREIIRNCDTGPRWHSWLPFTTELTRHERHFLLPDFMEAGKWTWHYEQYLNPQVCWITEILPCAFIFIMKGRKSVSLSSVRPLKRHYVYVREEEKRQLNVTDMFFIRIQFPIGKRMVVFSVCSWPSILME